MIFFAVGEKYKIRGYEKYESHSMLQTFFSQNKFITNYILHKFVRNLWLEYNFFACISFESNFFNKNVILQ